MKARHPRTRLVNFRISEDEFQTLQALTETSGARSMSDLARQRTLGNGNPQQPVDNTEMILGKVSRLEHQIAGFGTMLAELLGRSVATSVKPQQQEEQPVNGGLHH